jgi:hypothetical protein
MNEHEDAQLEVTLRTIEDDGTAAKPGKGAKQPLVRSLIQQVLAGEALLFHNQFHDGYIAPQGDRAEVLRLRSRQFRTWLHYYTHTVLGQPLNPTRSDSSGCYSASEIRQVPALSSRCAATVGEYPGAVRRR